MGQLQDLPTLPTIVTEVLRIYEDPNSTSKDFASVFSRDQAMSLNILKLVNSSYYSLSKKITSVVHAINLLGYNEVRRLALGISVIKLFPSKISFSSFSHKDFWIHSLATGVAAEVLAKKIRLPHHEDAFICGLVHDVGKLILEQYWHERFEEILKIVSVRNIPFYVAEEKTFGYNHTYIGMKAIRKWALPDLFYYGVRFHHNPGRTEEHPEFVASIHTADHIVKKMNLGSSGDNVVPQLKEPARSLFAFTDAEWAELGQKILAKTKDARTFLTI